MKPTTPDVQIKGMKPLSETAYSIDPTAVKYIMSLLTSIYSNPIKAVVREYAANALDSHIEAGQTRPIEIELGDAWEPVFVVRDFGIGMTRDEVLRLFGQYGASTKRDSNEQIGSFGIGSKSALAYASSMTIIARKNGKQTTVAVTLNSDGIGSLNEIFHGETFEPNGVEISVPVKAGDRITFANEVNEFLRFWNPGLALFNGREHATLKGDKINDGEFLVVPPHVLSSDYVVMGNVAYPINSNHNPFTESHWSYQVNYRQTVVMKVGIGDLTIAPNREELIYDPKTIKSIQAAAKRFKSHIATDAQTAIDESETAAEAFVKAHQWRQGTFVDSDHPFTYDGDEIPTSILSEYGKDNRGYFTANGKRPFMRWSTRGYGRTKHTAVTALSHDDVQNLIDGKSRVIVGFNTVKSDDKVKALTPVQREKIKYYFEEILDLPAADTYLFYHERPGDKWLDDITMYDWNTVNGIKLPAAPKAGKRGSLPVKVIDYVNMRYIESSEYTLDDLLTEVDKPIVLVSPSEYNNDYDRSTLQKYVVLKDEFTFVLIGKNRFDRVKREATVEVYTIPEWKALLSKRSFSQDCADRVYVAANEVSILPHDGLDDPDLVRYNGLRKQTDEVAQYEKIRKITGVVIPEPSSDIISAYDIYARYPLLEAMRYARPHEHVALYLNHIYEREVK